LVLILIKGEKVKGCHYSLLGVKFDQLWFVVQHGTAFGHVVGNQQSVQICYS